MIVWRFRIHPDDVQQMMTRCRLRIVSENPTIYLQLFVHTFRNDATIRFYSTITSASWEEGEGMEKFALFRWKRVLLRPKFAVVCQKIAPFCPPPLTLLIHGASGYDTSLQNRICFFLLYCIVFIWGYCRSRRRRLHVDSGNNVRCSRKFVAPENNSHVQQYGLGLVTLWEYGGGKIFPVATNFPRHRHPRHNCGKRISPFCILALF